MDTTTNPTPRWADQPTLLVDLASIDLAESGDVQPTLVAFDATHPLFLVTLRPFDRGRYVDAIVEVGAVAHALAARRIAVSLAGRAWSMDDPIPPVLPDAGDLRQRVHLVHTVDGLTTPAVVTTTIRPIVTSPEGHSCIGDPLDDMPGEGWLVSALPVLVGGDGVGGPTTEGDLAAQVLRCESMGHRFAWGSRTLARVQAAVTQQPAQVDPRDWLIGDAA